MKDNSKILIAVLVALAAGASIGLLSAPEKGKKTRRKISKSIHKIGDTIKETAETGLEKSGNIKDKIQKII